MKATTEQRQTVLALVKPYDTAAQRDWYLAAGLSNQRYRWDIYWTALDRLDAVTKYEIVRALDNLKDGHMNTLLRSVILDLRSKCLLCEEAVDTRLVEQNVCEACFEKMPEGRWVKTGELA